MTTKIKIMTSAAILAVTFAAGRYSVPLSVKKTTDVTKSDDKTDNKTEEDKLNKHMTTVIVDVTAPDGTKTKTTTRTVDVNNDKKTTDLATDTRREEKATSTEVTRSGSRLTISALAGTKISFSGPLELDYGAMVSRDFIGPISIGAFGFKSGVAGVAVGLSF